MLPRRPRNLGKHSARQTTARSEGLSSLSEMLNGFLTFYASAGLPRDRKISAVNPPSATSHVRKMGSQLDNGMPLGEPVLPAPESRDQSSGVWNWNFRR